ncbi:MAG: hypothetical protein IT410_03240 [Candidatus Doudnabacteria bacterium]|nr:hypothetical protein [Candidatus Doudnabacteria bacterium]
MKLITLVVAIYTNGRLDVDLINSGELGIMPIIVSGKWTKVTPHGPELDHLLDSMRVEVRDTPLTEPLIAHRALEYVLTLGALRVISQVAIKYNNRITYQYLLEDTMESKE